jgi:membrane protein DedA with SNARE-associated domain
MVQHILEFLRSALVQYGYWAVAAALMLENAGIPVPGETVLLMASFLAYSEHQLRLPWIVVIATLAATLGDNVGFALGFYGGRPLLQRYSNFFRIRSTTLAEGERLFGRYGVMTVFFARFVFGLRIIAGPLAGVLRMQWQKFLLSNFLGAALWVTAISGAGYLFGQEWERLANHVKRLDMALAILVLLGVFYWWRRSRRDRQDENRN